MDIALAEKDVFGALKLHRAAVFRLEHHPIAHFDAADVGTGGNHAGPGELAAHLRGGGDEDAAGGGALPLVGTGSDEDTVVHALLRLGSYVEAEGLDPCIATLTTITPQDARAAWAAIQGLPDA